MPGLRGTFARICAWSKWASQRDAVSNFGFALTLLTALMFLTAAPSTLGLLSSHRQDWERLSWIASVFGGPSAVLSAITGVAVALFLQRPQNRLEKLHSFRQIHMQLMGFAMADPRYAACWGPSTVEPGQDWDVHAYMNLIVQHLRTAWAGRQLPKDELRFIAGGIFRGEPGRNYWRWRRMTRPGDGFGTHRDSRFMRILDKEYREAAKAGPPIAYGPPSRPRSESPSQGSSSTIFVRPQPPSDYRPPGRRTTKPARTLKPRRQTPPARWISQLRRALRTKRQSHSKR
ncbi:hypothetical protein SAMN04489717_0442 [Actinopolymorpha singaporensis]|uniref:Uncharacterized protein n=2 Tax=Actinopolymorpha singaporensis TaxID=117157 RepID=A0A1H1LQR3_9ACTN|nr:hypothetical protein SAMN04489717_0442 [Actinopolymorpha singaporensis]